MIFFAICVKDSDFILYYFLDHLILAPWYMYMQHCEHFRGGGGNSQSYLEKMKTGSALFKKKNYELYNYEFCDFFSNF